MTLGSSGTTDQAQFDIGPLSWVMGEVREAISSASKKIQEALSQDVESQVTSLLHAKNHLHQANGAISMVEVEGVALLTETIEELLEKMQTGTLKLDQQNVTVISDALFAVIRYLEDILSGQKQQAVYLFPYYKALLTLKGADRIHPADLFFPALSMQEKIASLVLPTHPRQLNYTQLRSRFEKLLLAVLTQKDKTKLTDTLIQVNEIIADIEQAQTSLQSKAFWLVMRAYAEVMAQVIDKDEKHVKQILGRINLQIRRLVEGNASIPERLLRDALYFIAQVPEPTTLVEQIRKAYQLSNPIPIDVNFKKYTFIAPNVLTSAKEQLAGVKNVWGRIVNGDVSLGAKFTQKLKDFAAIGAKLNSPPLEKLLNELSGISSHATNPKNLELMGLELATCLLFIENSLDHLSSLPVNFSERADEISARLLAVVAGAELSTQASWIGELSREAQQRQTMAALVGEMQANLRQAEKSLDGFFREAADLSELNTVDLHLMQIGGALSILDQDDAYLAVAHTRQLIERLGSEYTSNKKALNPQLSSQIAQNVGALSFYIETLQSQPELVKKKFNFDPETGIFQSHLIDAVPAKEVLPLDQAFSYEENTISQTAEADLIEQQKQSERLLDSLKDTPDDESLHAQLRNSLDSERSIAALLDDEQANQRAKSAIEILQQNTTLSESEFVPPALPELVSTNAVVHELAPVLDIPDDDAAIDAELLEIFLFEADEVLATVQNTLPLSKNEVSNQEHLIVLRRSFHTLKGSGRMVGLTAFGEVAWSIEQVMNVWLSDAHAGTPALYELLDHVVVEMHQWVEELKNTGHSSRLGLDIISAAARVKEGLAFSLDAAPTNEVHVDESSQLNLDETNPAVAVDENLIELEQINFDESNEVIEALPLAIDHDDSADDGNVKEIASFISVDTTSLNDDLGLFQAAIATLPIASEAVDLVDAGTAIDVVDADLTIDLKAEVASEPTHDDLISLENTEVIADLVHIETNSSIDLESNLSQEATPEIKDFDEVLDVLVEDWKSSNVVPMNGINNETAQNFTPEVNSQNEITSLANSAKIIEFPDIAQPQKPLDDTTKKIGNVEISLPLHTIYMAETDEIVRYLSQDFAEWRHEASRPVSIHAVHAAHSLAGSSATVGLTSLQELAHHLENVLQRLDRHPVELLASEFDVLDECVLCMKAMLQKFALYEMASANPQENRILQHLLDAVIARSNVQDDEEFFTPIDELIVEEQRDEVTSEMPELSLEQAEHSESDAISNHEVNIVADASVVVNDLLDTNTQTSVEPIDAISLEVSADSVTEIEEDFLAQEEILLDTQNVLGTQISDDLDVDLLPVFLEEGADLLPMVGQLLRSWQQHLDDDAIPQSILRLMHTIKGSARMAGAMQLGQHTHEMETHIENLLHTGSALRANLVEDLLTRHDYAVYLFEKLQNPNLPDSPSPVLTSLSATASQASNTSFNPDSTTDNSLAHQANILNQEVELVPVDTDLVTPEQEQGSGGSVVATVTKKTPTTVSLKSNLSASNQTTTPLVRVRADILDRLVNQAGEVSISRSKLENEVETIRGSLSELTENVARLRDQLREVEIQAETQITSRMAFSGDREFDPLEFDRFTRLQELTRMMAESVSDVAAVQSSLHKTIDGASNDLTTQARLTRELQQDLMRVRMVPFQSVSERLFKVARQTAKETDKRVNLDIRGTSVEMDRGVLEKMVGPFEHLLRNAIVHGIEERDTRVANGKSEVGELLIEIRQEGNEVVIHFSDDGQGLHLERIRNKAKTLGLMVGDSEYSEDEVANLIFEAGFSTASEITELAGRGVGMDVVRSEAASLGGRVAVSSVEGKGAQFTIHLPLTLAVTQVVLLSVGGKTFAVPSVLVEQVQQLKSTALANAYNDGAILWQNQRVPMHYLPEILGDREVVPETQQYTPILIMKSDNVRAAIHVDKILGNKEVVVKNVGPQLARMIGIAGATVMGSGDIVLILNPVPLVQRAEHERMSRRDHVEQLQAPEMGAVAQMQSSVEVVEAVQGLRTQHIVMVVDDSLTVRKVTQRLLTREGYQVVLAKDGIDALEQLQAVTPDVMLVDIEMPRMDGFDLTRNVRSDERTRHIPIIMITSRTADKHRNYAMELGVNEYFGKPYREDELVKAISHFISQPG
jgi:chemosensory pili system protein ChpA (sensor histidine kinase/response regulator)